MTTTNQDDPDAIRREIDRTRGRLSQDVDVLAESVSPSGVAKRTQQRASDRAARLKETVMGTASNAASTVQDKAGSVTSSGSGTMHGAADAVTSAPDKARQQARGNPLAAGAVRTIRRDVT